MVDIVTRVNNVVNGFVWGPFGLALLLCTGLWLSVRTGFFQFRRMGYWLKHTIGAIFTNKDITAHTSKEDMAISQFQSMCTALAGTIGTGNIVGVATAIVSGGPGAIFWMWVMALLGMMTSFAENVLGVYYRRKNEKGEWNGGAMYYLTVTAPDGSDFGEYLTYNGRWGSPQKEYLMDTCWNAEAVLREAAGADEDWELYDSRLIQDDGIPYVCFRLEGETERYALVPPDGSCVYAAELDPDTDRYCITGVF